MKETSKCVVGLVVFDVRLNRHDPEEPLVDGCMSLVREPHKGVRTYDGSGSHVRRNGANAGACGRVLL